MFNKSQFNEIHKVLDNHKAQIECLDQAYQYAVQTFEQLNKQHMDLNRRLTLLESIIAKSSQPKEQ